MTNKTSFLSEFGDLLKSISDTFSKCIQKIFDYSLELTDVKESENGQKIIFAKLPEGTKLQIAVEPVSNSSKKLNLYFEGSDGKKSKLTNVMDKDVETKIVDEIKRVWDVDITDGKSTISESHKLTARLHRVYGSKEDTIELTAIKGNYDPSKMLSDLDTILGDDAFIDQISETPQSFEIVDEGDEFDVNVCDDCTPKSCAAEAIVKLLTCAIELRDDMQTIHWNACGEKFYEIHNVAGEWAYTAGVWIDVLAEICAEYNKAVPHPRTLAFSDVQIITDFECNGGAAFSNIADRISKFADCINCYRANFPADIQSTFDEWVRRIKQDADYKLARMNYN